MIKLAKYSVLIVSVFIVAACSMQKLTEKILPEPVRSNAADVVDAALQKDASFFADMKSKDMDDKEFAEIVDNMLGFVSEGAETRRDIVSASSQSNTSMGKGTNRAYNLTYEIQTEGGFTAIVLDYVQTPQQGECCELIDINVTMSDTSPYRVMLESMAKIFKIIGLAVLLAIFLIVFFLVRHLRKKKSGRA